MLCAEQGDFANCSLASKQLKMLNDYMDPQLRIRASMQLIKDIESLREQLKSNKTGLPERLLRLCFNIKRESFKATFIKGGPSLLGSYDFLLVAGKYFFYETDYEYSHEALEQAVKLRPNLFEPNFLAVQAWVNKQVTADKPLPTAPYEAKIKYYADNILNSKDIKKEHKKTMMSFLASAEQKANRIYTARTMLQKTISLNPNDLKLRLQLGLLEEKSGNLKEAKKIYESAVAMKLMDPQTEKLIYRQLLKLYSLFGEKNKQVDTATKALALFPGDTEFKKFAGERTPAAQ